MDPEPNQDMGGIAERLVALAEMAVARTKAVEAKLAETGRCLCPKCSSPRVPDMPASTRASVDSVVVIWKECVECNMRAALSRCEVPDSLLHCSFESWVSETESDRNAVGKALEYADKGFNGWAMFASRAAGIGKTHLAVACVRRWFWKSPSAWFITARDFGWQLKRTYRDSKVSDPEERARLVKLLVFDDLGSGSLSNDEARAVEDVMAFRAEFNRPTIVTTNMERDEIKAAFNPSLLSRMRSAITCWVKMTGEGRRKAGTER